MEDLFGRLPPGHTALPTLSIYGLATMGTGNNFDPHVFYTAPPSAGQPGNRIEHLDERFLGSNHIRLHRRACRTMCERRGSD
jgi:hypothetical protein